MQGCNIHRKDVKRQGLNIVIGKRLQFCDRQENDSSINNAQFDIQPSYVSGEIFNFLTA